MEYALSSESDGALAIIKLNAGETVKIENGSMVYHNGKVKLEGKMNSGGNDGGIGGFFKAAVRSMTTGESFFITHAQGKSNGAILGIAPGTPGSIKAMEVGKEQWFLNDGAFLACDSTVDYTLKTQSLGAAIFGGTGGLVIMQTTGQGTVLVNSYSEIIELNLDGSTPYVVDNTHVIAWTTTLSYDLKFGSGLLGFTSGEGIVNEFEGVGRILIQTRNLPGFANALYKFLPKNK